MKKFTLYLGVELHKALEDAARKRRDKVGSGRPSITALIKEELEKKYLRKAA